MGKENRMGQDLQAKETGIAQPSLHQWLADQGRYELDALVLDIDGVLLAGKHAMPGAVAFIEYLHRIDMPFALLTNDGCHSPEEKCGFLKNCGTAVESDDIVSCGHGIWEIVEEKGWSSLQFFVMGSLGEPCYARRAGVSVSTDIEDLADCQGVIVGEKEYDWYNVITGVFNAFARDPDKLLIVPNPDEFFPSGPETLGIASGAVGRFLQQLCTAVGIEKEPIYLGKPYEPIFQYNHHHLEKRVGRQMERERVLMVGDSLSSDIPGAQHFGYKTALMLTGITSPEKLADSADQPDMVFESL